jgi:hypothetical protein
MKIEIKFACDNAAFDNPSAEVRHILNGLATRINNGHFVVEPGEECKVIDTNGNTIGTMKVKK